jgi:hypothetical protein
MKALLTMVFMLILVGCSHKPELVLHGYEKNYILGETRTAYTGEPVLKVRDYYVQGIRSSQANCFELSPSDDFTLAGTFTKKSYFDYDVVIKAKVQSKYQSNDNTQLNGNNYSIVDITDIKGETYGLLIDSEGNILSKTIYNDDHDNLMVSQNADLTPKNAKFTRSTVPIPCKRTAQNDDTQDDSLIYGIENYELLFGGINNVTLTMTYREFTRDLLARPSFFQNLVYETSAKEIRFKNIKISIIEVSNEKIVYRVVEDGLEGSVFDNSADKVYRAILEEDMKMKK